MILPPDSDHGLLASLLRLSELLPPAYARFRPLLADALLFFLARDQRAQGQRGIQGGSHGGTPEDA